MDKIYDFRKKYNIKKPSSSVYSKFSNFKNSKDERIFHYDLFVIIQELRLSKYWLPVIFDYVTTGKINTNYDPEGIIVFETIHDNPKYTETEYFIQIRKNTTDKDLTNAWKMIKKEFKLNDSKEKESKNFDRDTFAYQLRKEQGLNYREIRELLNDNGYGKLDEPYIRSLVNKREKKIESLRTVYLKK